MPLFSDDRKCRRENLDQIIQRMYTETEENKDGLIIIGRCNPLALKKLNQKYRSVVSVNRNSTNYEVDEVLENNLDVIPEYVVETDQTEREGYEAMEKLLKSEDCPTGIYCANDITAVGILKYLRKCRNLYFTPSIIASDDIEEAQFTKPMLTTVGLPKEEMGRFALYLLLE